MVSFSKICLETLYLHIETFECFFFSDFDSFLFSHSVVFSSLCFVVCLLPQHADALQALRTRFAAESEARAQKSAQKSAADATQRAQAEIDRLTADRSHLIAQVFDVFVCLPMLCAFALCTKDPFTVSISD